MDLLGVLSSTPRVLNACRNGGVTGRTPDVRDRAPALAPAILEVRVSHRDTLEDVSQSEDLG